MAWNDFLKAIGAAVNNNMNAAASSTGSVKSPAPAAQKPQAAAATPQTQPTTWGDFLKAIGAQTSQATNAKAATPAAQPVQTQPIQTQPERKSTAWETFLETIGAKKTEAGQAKRREELQGELQSIEANSGYIMDPEEANRTAARRKEILAELDNLDREAGKEPQHYGGAAGRARETFETATSSYLSGLVNQLGTSLAAAYQGVNTNENAGWATDELSAGQIGFEHDESKMGDYAFVKNASDTLEQAADKLGEDAAVDLERAKRGLGRLGQAGVDIATNIIQMGYDAALGRLAGGHSLLPMFMRSSGSTAMELRQEGASVDQQIVGGAFSGGIEVATEKIFDGVAGIFGKGAADEVVERVIGRLSGSNTGRTLLRVIVGAGGEGLEEAISDVLNPIARSAYMNESLRQNLSNLDLSEIVYDFLIGAAIGGLGGVASIATGQNAAKNNTLALRDSVEQRLMQRGYDSATARRVGELAAKEISGETLNEAERRELERWPTALELIRGVGSDVQAAPSETPQNAPESPEDLGDESVPESAPESTIEAPRALNSAQQGRSGYDAAREGLSTEDQRAEQARIREERDRQDSLAQIQEDGSDAAGKDTILDRAEEARARRARWRAEHQTEKAYSSPEIEELAERFIEDRRERNYFLSGKYEYAEYNPEQRAEILNEIDSTDTWAVNENGELYNTDAEYRSRQAEEEYEADKTRRDSADSTGEADPLAAVNWKIDTRHEEPSAGAGTRVTNEMREADRQSGRAWVPGEKQEGPKYTIQGLKAETPANLTAEPGMKVRHKPFGNGQDFGEGEVVKVANGYVTVTFENGETKSFQKALFGSYFQPVEGLSEVAETGTIEASEQNGGVKDVQTADADVPGGDKENVRRGRRDDGRGTDRLVRERGEDTGRGKQKRETERRHSQVVAALVENGARVYAESDVPTDIQPAVDLIRGLAPDCPVTVIDSKTYDVAGHEKLDGKSAGIVLNAEKMRAAAKADGVTVQQIAKHEAGHYWVSWVKDSVRAIHAFMSEQSKTNVDLRAALIKAFNRHGTKIHQGLIDHVALWEEVFNDLYSDNPRAFMPNGELLPGYETARDLIQDYYENELIPQAYASMEAGESQEAKGEEFPFTFGSEEVEEAPASEQPPKRWSEQKSNQDIPQEVTDELTEREKELIAELENKGYRVTKGVQPWDETNAENRAREDFQAPPTPEEAERQARERRKTAGEQYGQKAQKRMDEAAERLKGLEAPVFARTSDEGSPIYTESQQTIVDAVERVKGAFSRVANGEAELNELLDAYEALNDEDICGGGLYDALIQGTLDAAREAEKRAAAGDDKRAEADYHQAVERAAAEIETTLTRRCEAVRTQAAMATEIEAKGRKNVGSTLRRRFGEFLGEQLRPDVMFKLWGGADRKASPELHKLAGKTETSTNRKTNVFHEAKSFFSEIAAGKEAQAWERSETTCEVEIPGYQGKLSEADALALLLTLEDERGLEHVILNGLRLDNPTVKKASAGSREGETVSLDFKGIVWDEAFENVKADMAGQRIPRGAVQAEAEKLATTLVEELRDDLHKALIREGSVSKAMYDAAHGALDYLAGEINQTSQVLLGHDIAEPGKHYWPLRVQGESRHNSANAEVPRLLSELGILQERTGPAGAVKLTSFPEAMNRYMAAASDYAAFAELADDLRLADTVYTGTGRETTDTLSGAAARLDEKNAAWLRDYVADLNNARQSNSGLLGKLRRNLAQSSLLLNGGVALKQTPSYWDFAGEVPMPYLLKHTGGLFRTAKSFMGDELVKGVSERTNVLSARQVGYNTVEMGEAAEAASSLSGKVLAKLPKVLSSWINKSDVRTVSNGLMAIGDWVEKETGLKRGTDAFYQEVANRFEGIILRSQPVYQKQFRAAYMRSNNEVVRTLAMFRTQQTQNLNQLITAWSEWKATEGSSAYTEAERRAAKSKLRQTVAGQVAAQFMFALLSTAARLGLHKKKEYTDEDGSFDWGKAAKRVGLDFLESSAGVVWFGDTAAQILIDGIGGEDEFYGLSDNVLELVSTTVKSLIALRKNPNLKTAKNAALSLSNTLGIPAKNAYNMLNSFLMWNADWFGFNPEGYDDAITGMQDYLNASDEKRAKLTVSVAMDAYRKGPRQFGIMLMTTLGEEGFQKQIGAAISDAYAKGRIDEVFALNWMKEYAGESEAEAKTALGKARVNYEFGKTEDEFEKSLHIDETLEKLGAWTRNRADRLELEGEIEDYLKDERKRELAEDLGEEWTSDYDKVAKLKDPLKFLGFRKAWSLSDKSQDTDALDRLLGSYAFLGKDAKELLDSSSTYSRVDDRYKAWLVGIRSEAWEEAYAEYKRIRDSKGSATDHAEAFATWLSKQPYNRVQRMILTEQMKFTTILTADTKTYDKLVTAGLSNDMAQYYSGLKRGEDADSEAELLTSLSKGRGSLAEKEKAMSVYLSDSAMKRWQRAKAQDISLANWAKFLTEAKRAHFMRTGTNSGSLSKADIKTACEALGWNKSGDFDQMYQVYKGE